MTIEVINISVKALRARILTAVYKKRFLKILIHGIERAPANGRIVVDFSGIDLISYKFCAEVADVLIRTRTDGHRLLQGKSLILVSINEESSEAIAAAMQLRNDAVLAYNKGPVILGHFPPFLQETFNYICAHEPVTANQAAEHLRLKIGVAAERLRRLSEWGFVVRELRPSTRKAVYEYRIVDPFA